MVQLPLTARAQQTPWKACKNGVDGACGELLRMAHGNMAEAQYQLGRMMFKGQRFDKDEGTGRLWIISAAEQGHRHARQWLILNAPEERLIVGAFGLKLGETYDPAKALARETDIDGLPILVIEPPYSVAPLNKYTLRLDSGGRIAEIRGEREYEEMDWCMDLKTLLQDTLVHKYGKPSDYDRRMGAYLLFTEEARSIRVECVAVSTGALLSLTYRDEAPSP